MTFEIDGRYANRKGHYTVLEINPPKMTVRYEDGSEAQLNMAIQERIWENIAAEIEAKESSRAARAQRRKQHGDFKYYVKSLSMVAQEEISAPGWRDKVTMVAEPGPKLLPGSRVIYFAMENRAFFAVATVTGEASTSSPKGFFYPGKDPADFTFYPIDMDVSINNLDLAIPDDSVELESAPNFKSQLHRPETYLEINEDDFELLSELLTEIIEEEEEEDEDLEEEDEDYEE